MRHPASKIVPDPAAPAEARPVLASATHDVGIEPPLDASGALGDDVDRRGVNVRWLGASILTAVTGAALIGGAIWVAVEGDTHFAEMPQAAEPARPPEGDAAPRPQARRGDKLVRTEMVVTAKQSIRAPVTLRVADREVIRVRPFVRIATSLSLTSGVYATNIPPFNPLRLFAEDAGERAPEPAPPADVSDAEVSVMKRDLATVAIGPGSPALSDADVAAQLEEERRLSASQGARPTPIAPQTMLTRTLQHSVALPDTAGFAPRIIDAPFSSIEVRVVPENVTTLGKSDARMTGIEERGAMLRRGETLDALLATNGATPDQIRGIVNALGGRARVAQLPEGQQMRILLAPGTRPGEPRQVMRVILFGERGVEAIAAANDRGAFVAVTPLVEETTPRAAPLRPRPETEEEGEEDEETGGARLYESLYETAMKHELPRQTVEDLVRIFGYDVDFQRRVAPGDTFEIFYTYDEEGGSDRIELLFAALSVGGETRRVYRFQSPDDGSVDYFDEQGRSLKKFLLRKPIAEGILRSGFGYRRHPILGYSKMHTGVDWSNRIGTPIVSAGNGTVTKAEWDSGYGRRVEVQHANGYVTAYSHMSRFAAGIRPGARVRQGQVIGYVGNTGLSTGPHLHYEVIVNGRFVDPMRIRVPRGRELDGRALAEFKRQRETVDGLLTRAGSTTRVAQREGQ